MGTRIQEQRYYAPSGGIRREERMRIPTLGKTLYSVKTWLRKKEVDPVLYEQESEFHYKIESGYSTDLGMCAQIFSRFLTLLLCHMAPSFIWLVLVFEI
jgi:hypothetical protein